MFSLFNTIAFKKAVKASKGKVIVLVHPYYSNQSSHPFEDYQTYINLLSKLIQAKHKIPVILLEEKRKQPKTEQKLAQLNPFTVQTKPADPEPIDGWDKLHKHLTKSGVKTVLIGGMNSLRSSYIAPHAKPIIEYEKTLLKPPLVGITLECVSGVYSSFIQNKHLGYIKIHLIPRLLFPHQPLYTNEEIKNAAQRRPPNVHPKLRF